MTILQEMEAGEYEMKNSNSFFAFYNKMAKKIT